MAYTYSCTLYKMTESETLSCGTVQYNVDTTTSHALVSGDTITINGVIYVDGGTYLDVCTTSGGSLPGVIFSNGDEYYHRVRWSGRITKNRNTYFSIQGTLANLSGYSGQRNVLAGVDFLLSNDDGEYEGLYAFSMDESNCFYYLTSRANPTFGVTPLTLTDTKGYLTQFGDYVQNESNLSASISATADPLDSEAVISEYSVTIGTDTRKGTTNSFVLGKYNLNTGTSAYTATVSITVKDNYGNTSTTTSSSITFLAYQEPVLKLNAYHPDGGASDYNENEFVQRYKHRDMGGGDWLAWPADDGTRVWVHLCDSSVAKVANSNAWNVTLSYVSDDGTESGTINDIGIPAQYKTDGQDCSEEGYFYIATCLYSSIMDPASQYEEPETGGITFSTTKSYRFTVTLTDQFHSVSKECSIPKAGAYFYVGKYGVAVGMRSTGTSTEKKFEVASDYTTYFGGKKVGAETYNLTQAATNIYTENVDTGGTITVGSDTYKIYRFTALDLNGCAVGEILSSIETPVLYSNGDLVLSITGGFWASTGAFLPYGMITSSSFFFSAYIKETTPTKICYRACYRTAKAMTIITYAKIVTT